MKTLIMIILLTMSSCCAINPTVDNCTEDIYDITEMIIYGATGATVDF